MPEGVRMIARVSGNGASRRGRFLDEGEDLMLAVLDFGTGGDDGERCCEWWPFTSPCPFILGRELGGGVVARSGGIEGSARSLRSVIFFRSLSAFAFSRLAHCRRGWF